MHKILSSKHVIPALLLCLVTLLVINSIFSFYNSRQIIDNDALKNETENVKQRTDKIISNIIHGADLSVRGFAITKNPSLADPLRLVLRDKDSVFHNIETLLVKQNYDVSKFHELKTSVEDYLAFSMDMIELVKKDRMNEFVLLLNEDRGFGVWKKYQAFYEPLFAYEDSLNAAAEARYQSAVSRNQLIQVLLVLISVPTMFYIIRKLRSEEAQRTELIAALDQNNRKYVFNSGASSDQKDWKNIVADSINNFQHANDFITRISGGDFATRWEGLTEENEALNTHNLAGNLLRMRENLKQRKIEDERRTWAVSGLAKFAEIIRNHNDFQKLGDAIISNIVRYTDSNQGGLYVVNEENPKDVHLRLLSCYAWDKKKHFDRDKNIYMGDGQAGQCWQEGEPIFITEVPADYVNITSGLGAATPRCIFIVPLKTNGVTCGILELASFQPYQDHVREYILEVCKSIAAAVAAVKMSERTRALLVSSQQQASEMQDQAEEMRAALEELHIVKETLRRCQEESLQKANVPSIV